MKIVDYKEFFDKLVTRVNTCTCIKIIKINPEIAKIGRRNKTREFFYLIKTV